MTSTQSPGRVRLAPFAIGLLLIIGGFIMFTLVSRTSRLTTRIMELKQAGLPTSGAELNDFYTVPAGKEDTTALWVGACELVRTPDFMDRVAGLPVLGQGEEIPAFGEEWPQLTEAKTAVETTLKKELDVVRQAARVGGRVRFPIDFKDGFDTLLTDTQEMRTMARLLQLDAQVAAREGDSARVLEDIRGMYMTADALAQEPTLISQLVRIAIRAMANHQVQELVPHCDFSDQQLAELQKTILQTNLRAAIARAYIGERAIGLDAIEDFASAPFRSENKLLALDIYEEATRNHDKSWEEIQSKQAEADDRLKTMSGGFISKFRYSAALTILPATAHVVTAAVRAEASQRCTVLAIAALRQKLRDGKYPTALPSDELLGGNSDVTIDPFTDKLMLIVTSPDSLIYYSAGPDGTDDGGKLDAEGGRLPDIGIKLPLSD